MVGTIQPAPGNILTIDSKDRLDGRDDKIVEPDRFHLDSMPSWRWPFALEKQD